MPSELWSQCLQFPLTWRPPHIIHSTSLTTQFWFVKIIHRHFYCAPVPDNSTLINNSRHCHGTVPVGTATQLLVVQQDLGFISSIDNSMPSCTPRSALRPSYSLIQQVLGQYSCWNKAARTRNSLFPSNYYYSNNAWKYTSTPTTMTLACQLRHFTVQSSNKVCSGTMLHTALYTNKPLRFHS